MRRRREGCLDELQVNVDEGDFLAEMAQESSSTAPCPPQIGSCEGAPAPTDPLGCGVGGAQGHTGPGLPVGKGPGPSLRTGPDGLAGPWELAGPAARVGLGPNFLPS
jgi:hypothetical protein